MWAQYPYNKASRSLIIAYYNENSPLHCYITERAFSTLRRTANTQKRFYEKRKLFKKNIP